MKNRYTANILLVIGWMIIFFSFPTLIPILAGSFDWGVMVNSILGSFPYLMLGILLIWLGQRINKNIIVTQNNDKYIKNKSLGKTTKIVGWIVTILASIFTGFGYMAMTSDAQGRAYAPLILSVGILFVCVGLVIVWSGIKVQKNGES